MYLRIIASLTNPFCLCLFDDNVIKLLMIVIGSFFYLVSLPTDTALVSAAFYFLTALIASTRSPEKPHIVDWIVAIVSVPTITMIGAITNRTTTASIMVTAVLCALSGALMFSSGDRVVGALYVISGIVASYLYHNIGDQE